MYPKLISIYFNDAEHELFSESFYYQIYFDPFNLKFFRFCFSSPNFLFHFFLQMILTEYFTAPMGPQGPKHKIFGRPIPQWIVNAYCVIGVFAFGAACSQLITDIMKYMVGRLRPHFFYICKPNVNCSIDYNLHRYITDYVCTNDLYKANDHIYKEMRYVFKFETINMCIEYLIKILIQENKS